MMKRHLTKFVVLMVFALVCALSSAQTPAKLYTKKMRMADFPDVVTKVVLGEKSMLEMAVRQEVVGLWNSSPYEFCSPEEYETLKTDNSLFFLRFVQADGVVFLSLSRGGKEDETDQLKIPFEVVRVPVGAYGQACVVDIELIGAFVDIIQQFALQSMTSDRVGYSGIGTYNGKSVSGKTIVLSQEKISSALAYQLPDVLVGVSVTPLEINFNTWCYKMLIDAQTHEMYYYTKVKYREKSDAWFSEKELSRFEKRNATIER